MHKNHNFDCSVSFAGQKNVKVVGVTILPEYGITPKAMNSDCESQTTNLLRILTRYWALIMMASYPLYYYLATGVTSKNATAALRHER